MIFNESLLFVHMPKTAGMSLTQRLLDVLPRPVWYSLPWDASRGVERGIGWAGVKKLGQVLARPLRRLSPNLHGRLFPRTRWDHGEGITYLDGFRHEPLAYAGRVTASYGRPLDAFKKIVSVSRNPYDLEVSRYAFFRRPDAVAPEAEKRLAQQSSFEEFVRGSAWFGVPDGKPDSYFVVDGEMPKNLDIVRFENLDEDLARVLGDLGIDAGASLPWQNRTRHAQYSEYMTPGAEEAVYERFRVLFEAGLYARERA